MRKEFCCKATEYSCESPHIIQRGPQGHTLKNLIQLKNQENLKKPWKLVYNLGLDYGIWTDYPCRIYRCCAAVTSHKTPKKQLYSVIITTQIRKLETFDHKYFTVIVPFCLFQYRVLPMSSTSFIECPPSLPSSASRSFFSSHQVASPIFPN